jgi:hypothetical protein
MDKGTVVIPGRGLGNRLISLAFSKAICKISLVIWLKNHECNARYDELFRSPKFSLGTCAPHVYLRYQDYVNGKSIKEKMHNILHKIIETGSKPKKIVEFYKSLKPSKNVEPLILKIPPNTLGIHLRLTDHLQMQSEDHFKERIKNKIKELKPKYVFIVSDTQYKKDEIINDILNKLMPGKVLFNHTNLSNVIQKEVESPDRNTLDGMQLATAEMFSLSKCKWILPNSTSSFSLSANLMGSSTLL